MSGHRRQGRAPSDAWWTLGELRRVLALVESGQESYSSLGRQWGVTQASISKAVITAGLRRRSPRELALLYMIEVGPVSLTGLTEAFPAWSKDRARLALRQLRDAAPVGEVPLGLWEMSDDFALDLSDPTGRAHAAWWLASEVAGIPATAVWDGTPDGTSEDRFCWWRLRWRSVSWPNPPAGTGCTPYNPRDIPSLRDLDPDDQRTLPDGSRWVDAEALRRVVLHVAGREVTP